jgi:putative ABC transport system permease protein
VDGDLAPAADAAAARVSAFHHRDEINAFGTRPFAIIDSGVMAILRRLRRHPAPFLLTAVTIALVTGVGTAVFAVVSATLLRPLPFPDSERLVRVFTLPPGLTEARQRNPLHSLDFVRFRDQSRTLDDLEVIWPRDRGLSGAGDPVIVKTGSVSAGFFAILGGRPELGRVFTPDEDIDGNGLVILSHGMWQRLYGGDSAVIGRTISLDGAAHAVVGVMRADFQPAYVDTELWTPLGTNASHMPQPGATFSVSVGRLAPGRTLGDARAEIASLMAANAREAPTEHGWTAEIVSLREAQFGKQRSVLLVLFAMALLLFAVACTNVANVTLAEMLERRGEFALRASLGASTGDLLRMVLVESVVVFGTGTVAGLLLAQAGLPIMLALDPATANALGPIAIDWRVEAFAAALAAILACVSGVWPAGTAMERLSQAAVDDPRRATASPRARRLRAALVVAQTAVTLVLLVIGGALVEAFLHALRVAPGYDPQHVLTAQLSAASRSATTTQRIQFIEDVLDRMRAHPEVIAAASVNNRFQPGFTYVTLFDAENRPTPDQQQRTSNFRRITPGYFPALRVRVLRGRDFAASDRMTAPPVAIVSEALAEQVWPGEDPLGHRLRRAADQPWITVVGVVDDVRDVSLTQRADPTLYLPLAQNLPATAPAAFVVRFRGEPASAMRALRAAVASADRTQVADRFVPLVDFVGSSLAPDRFRTALLVAFAATGLLLAIVGLYGLTSRAVTERTKEIGVRLALGARPSDVWVRVTAQTLTGVGLGIAGGLALAQAAIVVLVAALTDVQRPSALVWAIAIGVLSAVSTMAAAVPARRVVGIDPSAALRSV